MSKIIENKVLLGQFTDAFGKVMQASGRQLEGIQIERLFMQIDANSDGGIDWNEFSNYMLMESQANQTEIAETVVSLHTIFFVRDKFQPRNLCSLAFSSQKRRAAPIDLNRIGTSHRQRASQWTHTIASTSQPPASARSAFGASPACP